MSAFDAKWAADYLERRGWLKEVAGEYDFGLADDALARIANAPGKGLLLMGNVGVGKTTLADIVFGGLTRPKMRIDCADNGNVDWLVGPEDRDMNGGAFNSEIQELMDANILLDDIGTEDIRKVYGNDLDRVGKFIVRYHARGRRKLIVTTNLDGDALQDRYGSCVWDRLLDKCVVVRFSGKSKRERTVLK